jgi:hypothetical protein
MEKPGIIGYAIKHVEVICEPREHMHPTSGCLNKNGNKEHDNAMMFITNDLQCIGKGCALTHSA